MHLKPCTLKKAIPWVRDTHRHLPKVQGGMWAISIHDDEKMIGVAIVGHPARLLMERGFLCVLRVSVLEGHKNACSMLYGACARAAKAMGAAGLVTYTLLDESGTSLRAAGWTHKGISRGGEYNRPSRGRPQAKQPGPKNIWWAPFSEPAPGLKKAFGNG
jgi:hypothetical protein